MSDLGRLFRLRRSAYVEPLENFTTTALAIAINRDPLPMAQALLAVGADDRHPGLSIFEGGSAAGAVIYAETQKRLLATDNTIASGYLDLVLTVVDSEQRKSTIWVEVKVNAWESGDQLATYKKHAALLSPSPAIITLAKMQLNASYPFLTWSDLRDAVASASRPHYAWLSLVEFLLDEKIVRGPVPEAPTEPQACIDVVVDINQRVRALWPQMPISWPSDGPLRSNVVRNFEAGDGLVTTGGPLLYGLMPSGAHWQWGLVVRTENYQKVPLDADQMIQEADLGGLPQDWVRHADRREVLERRLPVGGLTSHDEIVAWFDEGLRQLRAARVLDRFLSAVRAGEPNVAPPAL